MSRAIRRADGFRAGTTAIIGLLLYYIQGESSPIYQAEQRHGLMLPGLKPLQRWGGCIFIVFLLAMPILAYFERQFGRQFPSLIEIMVYMSFILVSGAITVGWTVPLAMLAGQGISRERTMQTLDLLLVTPHPTESVLIAKAAANVQRVWKIAISLALLVSLPGMFVILILLMVSTDSGTNLPPVVHFAFMIAAIVSIVVERLQEIALAITIGMAAAFMSDSRRMALIFGVIGGILIRLVQTIITLLTVIRLSTLAPSNFALLNIVTGSATALAVAPGIGSLVLVAGLIMAREILIRGLFTWTVRRARDA